MMTANPTHPDDGPPRSPGLMKSLSLVFGALALFYAFAVIGDGFPDAVVQVTGSVLIAFVLGNIAVRWVGWIRSDCAPSVAQRAIATLASLLMAYIFFRESWFNPIPGPLGTILTLSFFPLVLGSMMWSVGRIRDEVYRASAYESFAWGSLAGVGLIYALIVVLRFAPAAQDWLQARTEIMSAAPGGLPPAAVGFALGLAAALVMVWTSLFVSWALWWRRMR